MQKGAKSAAVAVGRAEGPPPLQTPIACVAKHEEEGRKDRRKEGEVAMTKEIHNSLRKAEGHIFSCILFRS